METARRGSTRPLRCRHGAMTAMPAVVSADMFCHVDVMTIDRSGTTSRGGMAGGMTTASAEIPIPRLFDVNVIPRWAGCTGTADCLARPMATVLADHGNTSPRVGWDSWAAVIARHPRKWKRMRQVSARSHPGFPAAGS